MTNLNPGQRAALREKLYGLIVFLDEIETLTDAEIRARQHIYEALNDLRELPFRSTTKE